MNNARITVYPIAGGFVVEGTMYDKNGELINVEEQWGSIEAAREFISFARDSGEMEFSVEWHNCAASDEPKRVGSSLMAYLYPMEFVEVAA